MAVSNETEQQSREREAEERARRDQERRQYQSEKSSKEQQKKEAEAAKAILEEKIRRLQEAYSKIHAVKNKVEDLHSGVQDQGEDMAEWIGQNFDKYSSFVSGDFKSSYKAYINELDSAQDEINREISRLQIEAADYGTLIDQLWARICQLGRWIQNLFN